MLIHSFIHLLFDKFIHWLICSFIFYLSPECNNNGPGHNLRRTALNLKFPLANYFPHNAHLLIIQTKKTLDINDVFNKIRIAVHKNGIRTTEFFKDHDKLRSGIITENQVRFLLFIIILLNNNLPTEGKPRMEQATYIEECNGPVSSE